MESFNILKNKCTSISSIIGPPHKLSMIWIFSAHSVSPNRQKIKTSNIFFFQKNFLRAHAKKIKHPKIWGLCLLSLVQKKIYRNFFNEHSNSQKKIWRARAVPIHKFCTSKFKHFFFANFRLFLAKKKYLKHKIDGLAPRARAKNFFVNYYAH